MDFLTSFYFPPKSSECGKIVFFLVDYTFFSINRNVHTLHSLLPKPLILLGFLLGGQCRVCSRRLTLGTEREHASERSENARPSSFLSNISQNVELSMREQRIRAGRRKKIFRC